MQTTVTELPDSRVRVEVEVPAEDVERGDTAPPAALAREMRMPGFRKGKAPPSLVIQRLGFGAVLEEAIRESLPEWYERALLDSGISPVGDPSIEIVSTPEDEGEPLDFKFEVGVRPAGRARRVQGPRGRAGRERGRPRRSSTARSSGSARASPGWSRSSARPPRATSLLIDFEGLLDGKAFEGGKADDYLLELGGGQLIEGFEEQLVGARPGEEREVEVTFPDDYQAEQLAGEDAVFKVKVKEVREKVLPELDDEFASEASEFDTLEELRADIREKVAEAVDSGPSRTSGSPRSTPPSTTATVELPDELVDRPRRGTLGADRTPARRRAAWTPTPSCRCRAKRARS